jgi:hypothetical protein
VAQFALEFISGMIVGGALLMLILWLIATIGDNKDL